MVNIMQHVAKSKKQKEMNICFHYASNVPEDWVEGDSNVLSQVFLNMMSNAVKVPSSLAISSKVISRRLIKYCPIAHMEYNAARCSAPC